MGARDTRINDKIIQFPGKVLNKQRHSDNGIEIVKPSMHSGASSA